MDASHIETARLMPGTTPGTSLAVWLDAKLGSSPNDRALALTLAGLADACSKLSSIIKTGVGNAAHGTTVGSVNADGDSQRTLDVVANQLIREALKSTPTAYFASEEDDAVVTLDPDGRLAVAVDPLDGSSNIDANISIGTIFAIFPTAAGGPTASILRRGRDQLAAGYVIYGPHTALVLTMGRGTDLFVLDEQSGQFLLSAEGLAVPAGSSEFAINMSNYRHWLPPIRSFVDDCLAGSDGPNGNDFNMRWVASLVAETHRILSRGGVFLYPADKRQSYSHGRLRLVYEAAPIAFLIEQAGGLATDGATPILDAVPSSLHQRTPLIFGSTGLVESISNYHSNPDMIRASSPLFRSRGLFSA